jgi:hypothetical protein
LSWALSSLSSYIKEEILYKRGKSPRAAKTAEIFLIFQSGEREREKERNKAETEKERKRQIQRETVGHIQGMGSPTCNFIILKIPNWFTHLNTSSYCISATIVCSRFRLATATFTSTMDPRPEISEIRVSTGSIIFSRLSVIGFNLVFLKNFLLCSKTFNNQSRAYFYCYFISYNLFKKCQKGNLVIHH